MLPMLPHVIEDGIQGVVVCGHLESAASRIASAMTAE